MLRDKFRAATREAIIDAAAGLLTEEGAPHVRMEDIATKAGIAVGTLYNYFEDRQSLVTALLETRTRSLYETLDAAAVETSVSRTPENTMGAADLFAAELQRFVAAVGYHFDTNRFLLTVLLEEHRARGIDAQGVSRRRSVLDELMNRAERLMAKGIGSGALRAGDPLTYAALLVGMIRGVAAGALRRQHAKAADVTAEVVRVFLTGAAR